MNAVLQVIYQNVLPIFLVASLGFFLRRQMGVDTKMVSRVAFYGFSPCLVFSSLVSATVTPSILNEIVIFATINIVLLAAIGWLGSKLLRLSRVDGAAVTLALMLMNAGNFGITINELRYGADGVARAVIFYVMANLFVNTLGVLVATSGRLDLRRALGQLARVPSVYAVVLAAIVYVLKIQLPAPLTSSIDIAGRGAIPIMLVVLGMQLADLKGFESLPLAFGTSLARLFLGGLLGYGLALLLGLEGLTRSVMIIQTSMPTAVIAIILATEFDVRPRLVTTIVAISTILSPLTVALVITLLGL
ncbi:MAG: AEC family transporter [Anaerolineales bacterium]|nr:AEC family transporter [Anaerolineales bacterium]MCB0013891.1 AEC family transporter [Anaerolineales bacterium]MCB8961957.1 AEC family transporter [Ardenticatenales bacterium]